MLVSAWEESARRLALSIVWGGLYVDSRFGENWVVVRLERSEILCLCWLRMTLFWSGALRVGVVFMCNVCQWVDV